MKPSIQWRGIGDDVHPAGAMVARGGSIDRQHVVEADDGNGGSMGEARQLMAVLRAADDTVSGCGRLMGPARSRRSGHTSRIVLRIIAGRRLTSWRT